MCQVLVLVFCLILDMMFELIKLGLCTSCTHFLQVSAIKTPFLFYSIYNLIYVFVFPFDSGFSKSLVVSLCS